MSCVHPGGTVREEALTLLRAHNPYGVPLENHCVRLAEFTLALARQQEVDHDVDLVWAAAYLHDMGLLVPTNLTKNYLKRGVAFCAPYLEEWGLNRDEQEEMNKLLLFNHSLRSVEHVSKMAEVVRFAVQVEHSLGRRSHGLSTRECRRIFERHPRRGFNSVLYNFFKISLSRDGLVEIFRYFYPDIAEEAWVRS